MLVLSQHLVQRCIAEVDAKFPLESGGVLMGRRRHASEIVVDQVIGPGPSSRHERYRFEPNLEWQHARIAESYDASNGASTYLGDWHSHPGATHGRLSSLDRGALRAIISAPEAQCPEPLMVIFWGKPGDWTMAAWQAQLRRWPILWSALDVIPLNVHLK